MRLYIYVSYNNINNVYYVYTYYLRIVHIIRGTYSTVCVRRRVNR